MPVLGPAASRLSTSRSRGQRRAVDKKNESLENLQRHLEASKGLLGTWVLSLPAATIPKLDPHWKMTSYVSSETFFENNFGFPARELRIKPVSGANSALRSFLRPASFQLQAARGFKSRRPSSTFDRDLGVPFKKTTSNQSEALDLKFKPSLITKEPIKYFDPPEEAGKEKDEKKNQKSKDKDGGGSSGSNSLFQGDLYKLLLGIGSVCAIFGFGTLVWSGMNNGMKLGVCE